MAKKIASVNVSYAFQRTKAIPLDNRSLYETYDEALLYAQTGKTAYVGQVISVEGNGDSKLYKIVSNDGVNKTIVPLENTGDIKTEKYIEINGGPLAHVGKDVFPNGIPSGTSVQDILTSLFCKELWAKNISATYYFDANVSLPSLSITNNSSYEIGTTLSLYETSPSQTTCKQYISASNFNYGYRLDDKNNSDISSDTYQQTNFVPTYTNTKKESVSFTNIDGENKTSTSLQQQNIRVIGEEGKITLRVTGNTYTADSNVEEHEIFVLTNLKNSYKEDKNTDNLLSITCPEEWRNGATKKPNNQTTITINGYRKYFYGYLTDDNYYTNVADIDSDVIRGLQHSDKKIEKGDYAITTSTGARQIIFAFPSNTQGTLTKVTSKKQFGSEITGNFEKHIISVASAENFDKVDYDVYIWTPAKYQDGDIYTITIS